MHMCMTWPHCVNTLRPRQNGRHFADDIFKCIFFNENVWILIKISLKFVPKGPINKISALFQIMAWRRPGDKPLSEAMLVSLLMHEYRNWPWYGLRWSGWYCNPENAGRHNECCSGLQYQPLQRRPYKWSISILPRSQFTKSKGNLRFRRLVQLFVPIGVCVTTHDDGTASDVTIGMWCHNQQVTNHERNGKPWFSLPE